MLRTQSLGSSVNSDMTGAQFCWGLAQRWPRDAAGCLCAMAAVDPVAIRPPFPLAPGQRRGLRETLGETTPVLFLLLPQRSSQAHAVGGGREPGGHGRAAGGCLPPAQSWLQRPRRRRELVPFKHGAGRRQPAWPPLPLRAASAVTAGEEGKLLQGAIRNISAFAAPGLRRPTRALPPARGPAALPPPEPPAPAALRGPILGELLETQQPVCHGEPRYRGVAAATRPRCSVWSTGWVAPMGARGCCGGPTRVWVPRDEGRAEPGESGAAVGDGLGPGAAAPAPWGSVGRSPGDMEQAGRVRRGAWGALGTRRSQEVPGGGNAAISASPNPQKPLCSQPFGSYFSRERSSTSDGGPRAGVEIPAASFASR